MPLTRAVIVDIAGSQVRQSRICRAINGVLPSMMPAAVGEALLLGLAVVDRGGLHGIWFAAAAPNLADDPGICMPLASLELDIVVDGFVAAAHCLSPRDPPSRCRSSLFGETLTKAQSRMAPRLRTEGVAEKNPAAQ